MKSVRSVVDALPPLKLNDSEETELQNLSENFVLANIEDYLEIGEDVRKTGNTPREWRELRRKDGIRVYTQRSKKGNDSGAAGLTVPSLLLFGTIQGALNDVMYAVSASNDEDIKVKSKFVQDGIVDAKRAPNSVECYVHGFFDFQEDDTVLSAISMNSMANQWLSFSQLIECAEMKKLVWCLRRKSARLSDTCSSSNSSFDSQIYQRRKSSAASNHCRVCTKSFGLLGSGKKTCKVCGQRVCGRCHVKKTVCTVRPWENTAILEKKLPVCGPCIQDILKGSTLEVARDEVHLRVYTRDSDWWSTSE
ncbi:uncharacterized protein KRP23_269 [Phytophthora ramorum]|uniref:uncharacterized protein n=1 Tax=Phytophthora ramorum TaxID=164328 RepID=UPI00309BE31E|nr:hypothetical protein KRP23_269 [Phytophthora ramorum]